MPHPKIYEWGTGPIWSISRFISVILLEHGIVQYNDLLCHNLGVHVNLGRSMIYFLPELASNIYAGFPMHTENYILVCKVMWACINISLTYQSLAHKQAFKFDILRSLLIYLWDTQFITMKDYFTVIICSKHNDSYRDLYEN